MNRKDWLEERRKSIGGSDAAAILGLNEWTSPYTVWADKTGRLPEKEDNEAMRQGRDLEQYVADRWMEKTGKKCRRRTEMLHNPKYSFAHANVDRWVVGENAGLECKTTSIMNLKKFKGGEFPETYYCQCVHYMAVTGTKRWYLAVLVLNQGFYEFVIERDQAEIDALMKAEAEFWKCVEKDTPPPVDGSKATTETIAAIYTDSRSQSIDLFGRAETLKAYKDIRKQIKGLETIKERYEQELKTDLGENEKGECDGFVVTWKPQSRCVFDTRSFAADHKDIDLTSYMKVISFRKFNVKERK